MSKAYQRDHCAPGSESAPDLMNAAIRALSELSAYYERRDDKRKYLVNQAIHKLWECDK